ncbi:MAG: LLM class flavin-dependent oxidoreductase [Candidatus Rokuibacteriota bacterium]
MEPHRPPPHADPRRGHRGGLGSVPHGLRLVSIGHHLLSHPTVWPQPFPVLARLAPETGSMRLKTSMLLLPLLNPVETAENVATLDHITHGRLDVGVAIGYCEKELVGLDGIGFTIYSLPREPKARIDYLQMIEEDVVRPAGARDG